MKRPVADGPASLVHKSRIIAVQHTPMKAGDESIIFEKAVRAPGVRLIVVNSNNELLLTKEYRTELSSYDYRLPGGKVFDKLEDYLKVRGNPQEILKFAQNRARMEAAEEAAIKVKDLRHVQTASSGATVEWDLLYFLITDFDLLDGQQLEAGEDITVTWQPLSELPKIVAEAKMSEYRSVGVLWEWYLNHNLRQYKLS